MSLTAAEKQDVLRNMLVELERSFFILSNHYKGPDLERMVPFHDEVETGLRACLADFGSKALAPDA